MRIPYDIATFHLPLAAYVARCVREGVFPFWDPYPYCGVPIHADLTHNFLPDHVDLAALLGNLSGGVARSAAYDPGRPVHVSSAAINGVRDPGGSVRRDRLSARMFFRLSSRALRRDLLRGLVTTGSAVRMEIKRYDHAALDRAACSGYRWSRSREYSGDSRIFLGCDFVNRAEVLLQN